MAPDAGAITHVRLVKWESLTPEEHDRWRALSDHAGAGNIFSQHWFMDAALRHTAGPADVRLVIVSATADGRWLGVMPLVAQPRFGRWPARIWRGWSATNQFLGTPLVAPESAELFWSALLAFLDDRASGEVLLYLREMATDDAVYAALMARCAAEDRSVESIGTTARPALNAGEASPHGSNSKRLGRLRSLSRRLEADHGAVSIDMVAPGEDCTAWTEAFLTMEHGGWKGAEGSALACDPANAALFRETICEGHRLGRAKLATLSAGGRPLAMSSWFEQDERGFGFKMAFDEQYRAYAPGQLLMRDIAERIGAIPGMRFDTCTPPQSGGCYRLWPHGRTIASLAIAIGGGRRRLYFDALMRARSAYSVVSHGLRWPSEVWTV